MKEGLDACLHALGRQLRAEGGCRQRKHEKYRN
jgi:hypothetical protein